MNLLNFVIIIVNYHNYTKIKIILSSEKCPSGYGISLIELVTIMATLAYTKLKEH